MATNTRTETSAHGAGTRVPAGHAPSPADERLLHPVRPGTRRPVRDPHSAVVTVGTTVIGGRTTPAAPAPSSAHRPLGLAPARRAHGVVAPTAVPDHSGDLLGLPDLSGFRRGLHHAWAWLVREVRASAEIDARLRARRDEDSAAMARAGANPMRFG